MPPSLPPLSDVRAMYASGHSLRRIARDHGCHRRHVRKMFADAELPLRSPEAQNRAAFMALPPHIQELRKQRLSQAAAIQGNSPEARRKRAKARERQPRTSASHRVLRHALTMKGYRLVMQAAFDEHNVDIALPDCGIAIDVITRRDLSEACQPRLAARRAAVEAGGYTYISVWDAEMQGRLVDNVVAFVLNMAAAGAYRLQQRPEGEGVSAAL